MALVATGIKAVSLLSSAVKGVKSFFTGGGCSGSQNQQKQNLANRIAQLTTASERRDLVGIAKSPIQPTPVAMADFYYGGHDCKHKNVSPGDRNFLDRLPGFLNEKERANRRAASLSADTAVKGVAPGLAALTGGNRLWIGGGILAAIIATVIFANRG